MTYIVSSGTLNTTIPCSTQVNRLLTVCFSKMNQLLFQLQKLKIIIACCTLNTIAFTYAYAEFVSKSIQLASKFYKFGWDSARRQNIQ